MRELGVYDVRYDGLIFLGRDGFMRLDGIKVSNFIYDMLMNFSFRG